MALKLSAPEIRHKSEVGALRARDRRRGRAAHAYARLRSAAAGSRRRMLVERMAEPGLELVVAARADAVVPALVVGLGGIWTEALDDVAVVPLPATPGRVERALRSLRGAPLLTGGRGLEPVALDGRGRARRARPASCCSSEGLALLELNPVVGRPASGRVALDAVAGPRRQA